jgi:type 1 glutamine amidotransferase
MGNKMKSPVFKSVLFIILVCQHWASGVENQFEVLVYTTQDPLHGEAIPTFINEMEDLAENNFFGLKWTMNGEAFTEENLAQFDVIVFLSARSLSLSPAQLNSFKKFIRNGGGFVGIHSVVLADDFSMELFGREQDEWYRKLIGRDFYSHPAIQTAVVKVYDKNFPATMHFQEQWVFTDEWYTFAGEPLTENLKDLLVVDESTYDISNGHWPETSPVLSMGDHHPVAWYQEYDGGRSFYTSLGHSESTYADETFIRHIFGGIYWAATGLGVSE